MLIKFFIIITISCIGLFANVGKIVALKGEANLIRDNVTSEITLGTIIEKNDSIVTKDNSRTQIFFNDETIITIGKKSKFEVNSYLFDNQQNSKAEFKFLRGSFKVISGGIGKINPKAFKLKTKSASIGIRGTQIDLTVSEKSEFIMCVEGSIVVTLLSSDQTKVLKAGESVSIKNTSPVSKKSPNNGSVKLNAVPTEVKVDNNYDTWTQESGTVDKGISDAFKKGHNQSYTTTYLKGTIQEATDGLQPFDSSDATNPNTATFNMKIDFGKEKNDNPLTVTTFKIKTGGSNNSFVDKIKGNINSNNEIELTYETDSGGLQNATGVMKFTNSDLDVEGDNLTFTTKTEVELVTIEKIELETK